MSSIYKIIPAFLNSVRGLRAAIREERAFRQEIALGVVLFPAAFFVADNGITLAVLWGSLFLVLVAELLNSGIESAIDRISAEHHPLSGRAKDLASAAVFLALVNVVLVWGAVIFF